MYAGLGHLRRATLVGAVLVTATLSLPLTASSASAAPALTSPAPGGTLPLEAGYGRFEWTMGPGEQDGEILVGSAPAADPQHEYEDICSGAGEGLLTPLATSCTAIEQLPADRWYGIVTDRSGEGETLSSAPIAFQVPPVLEWAVGDPQPGRSYPKAVEATKGGYMGRLEGLCTASGWTNVANGPVAFTIAITDGHRLLKRLHKVVRMPGEVGDGNVSAEVVLGPSSGVRFGTWLRCDVTMSGSGTTLRRSVRMKAP